MSIFTAALHESGTRKALKLGSWQNNTEVYLTPLIVHVLKITQLQDKISYRYQIQVI
jgi:hypothetical protein